MIKSKVLCAMKDLNASHFSWKLALPGDFCLLVVLLKQMFVCRLDPSSLQDGWCERWQVEGIVQLCGHVIVTHVMPVFSVSFASQEADRYEDDSLGNHEAWCISTKSFSLFLGF